MVSVHYSKLKFQDSYMIELQKSLVQYSSSISQKNLSQKYAL